ncbi:hypothetical protein [Sphingobacterium griseoflavum]|uniref:Nucleotide pyrophosphatase n=1 Tax=Sphingobacterium griseoflavum TaxID=1474952 RepID=A0ABQ3HT88_9SPHI|nr:hypothetical protein [Sphingobacterium griseoflavum]GHE23392.1 hypothetical protein GCM10017764_03600 [Sphingobacterium griseoflavum]
MKKRTYRWLALVLFLPLLHTSCTRYENPAPIFEEQEEDAGQSRRRKVLFISIDGAGGEIVGQVMPTHIAGLLPTSKYTFYGLADEDTGDAASWMTMMAGVSSSSHRIEDDSFIPRPNPDNPHVSPDSYRSLFSHLNAVASSLRSYVVSRSEGISNRLLAGATESFLESSDEAVKNRVVSTLQTKTSDVVVVQFTDVLAAGVTGGFSVDNSDYIAAIERVDGYVGEILAAVAARGSYEQEDWLIIVTSNHGGIDRSYGGNSDLERNTFVLFQNKRFQQLDFTTLDPTPDAIFFHAVDFFPQIFYWLELQTQESWNLEGQIFLNRFEVEFLHP